MIFTNALILFMLMTYPTDIRCIGSSDGFDYSLYEEDMFDLTDAQYNMILNDLRDELAHEGTASADQMGHYNGHPGVPIENLLDDYLPKSYTIDLTKDSSSDMVDLDDESTPIGFRFNGPVDGNQPVNYIPTQAASSCDSVPCGQQPSSRNKSSTRCLKTRSKSDSTKSSGRGWNKDRKFRADVRKYTPRSGPYQTRLAIAKQKIALGSDMDPVQTGSAATTERSSHPKTQIAQVPNPSTTSQTTATRPAETSGPSPWIHFDKNGVLDHKNFAKLFMESTFYIVRKVFIDHVNNRAEEIEFLRRVEVDNAKCAAIIISLAKTWKHIRPHSLEKLMPSLWTHLSKLFIEKEGVETAWPRTIDLATLKNYFCVIISSNKWSQEYLRTIIKLHKRSDPASSSAGLKRAVDYFTICRTNAFDAKNMLSHTLELLSSDIIEDNIVKELASIYKGNTGEPEEGVELHIRAVYLALINRTTIDILNNLMNALEKLVLENPTVHQKYFVHFKRMISAIEFDLYSVLIVRVAPYLAPVTNLTFNDNLARLFLANAFTAEFPISTKTLNDAESEIGVIIGYWVQAIYSSQTASKEVEYVVKTHVRTILKIYKAIYAAVSVMASNVRSPRQICEMETALECVLYTQLDPERLIAAFDVLRAAN